MFRFTIRDVLWLTIVVALALGWWVDSKRIENTVIRIEADQRERNADFQDRMAILDEVQKDAANGVLPRPGMVKSLGDAAASKVQKESPPSKTN
jgi:hypothetical protein